MDLNPGPALRRVPARDVETESDPVLLAAIRAEIAARGPMTFARFMEIALYDPARGYYRDVTARPGRAGDFLTAPEASPIFGRTIARFARAVHGALGAPGTFTIREHGAGTGALAGPLVAELLAGDDAPGEIQYLVAEIEPTRVAAVRSAVAAAAGDDGRVRVEADDGRAIVGLILANEVVDALPTHRIVGRGAALREIFVGLGPDGALVDIEGEPSTDALARRLTSEVGRPRRRPARRGLPRARRLGRRGRRRARARRRPADRLRPPGGRALRPAGGAAGTLATYGSHGRRRSVRRGRSPGPDRPCRRDRAGTRRRPTPASAISGRRRRRSCSAASAPASCSSRADGAGREPGGLSRDAGGPRPDDRPERDGPLPGPRLRARPGRRDGPAGPRLTTRSRPPAGH